MGSKLQRELKSLNKGTVHVVGTFFPNNTSAVANTSNKGRGFTVARTSQGLFTLTMSERYSAFVGGDCALGTASASAYRAQLGVATVSRSAANTVQIRIVDGSGAVQDLAANANNRVCFDFEFQHEVAN